MGSQAPRSSYSKITLLPPSMFATLFIYALDDDDAEEEDDEEEDDEDPAAPPRAHHEDDHQAQDQDHLSLYPNRTTRFFPSISTDQRSRSSRYPKPDSPGCIRRFR